MGRDFLVEFFKYKVKDYGYAVECHAFISELISLLILGGSYIYFFFNQGGVKRIKRNRARGIIDNYQAPYFLYYISLVAALLGSVSVFLYVYL